MFIPFGIGDWGSKDEKLSKLKLSNLYMAENPFAPEGRSAVTRPTLSSKLTVGSGPIYGIYTDPGSLNDIWLVVSGTSLYAVSPSFSVSLIGSIPGTGFCTFASTKDRVLVLRDNIPYLTDGTTVAILAMPDNQKVGSITSINSSFLLSVLNSYRFYWMTPDDIVVDPLSFASAERFADAIVCMVIISDEIWLIGETNIEVWQTTGDADAPYLRIAGRSYPNGCRDALTVCNSYYKEYPCAIWVTDKNEVIIGQGSTSIVSTSSVEEYLNSMTNLRCWSFRSFRNSFYVLSGDERTLVFDLSSGIWSEWSSTSFLNWRAHLGIQVADSVFAGDASSNTVWQLGEDLDDAGSPIIRTISGFVPLTAKQEKCSSVNVRANVGNVPSYITALTIELRWSDDLGFSWSNWQNLPFSFKGQYSIDLSFKSLGVMKRPGRVFELRYSEQTRFRLDYATMNEV